MKQVLTLFRWAAAVAGTLAVALLTASPSVAADIIAEWATVKAPPVPELKPVTLDGKTTALLILDMMKTNCPKRPRCSATVPNVKKLHDAARAAGAMVFYSLVGGDNPTPADIVDPGIAPRDGEWVFQRGPDKYLGFRPRRAVEKEGHQNGYRVRHLRTRCGHRHRQRLGAAGLQGHRAGRLHVVRRSLHGAICGLAYVQGRAGHRHRPDDAHAQRHDQVLINFSLS